jgi:hypothetical protein
MTALNRNSALHFRLHHDSWGRLVLTDVHGRQYVGVEPIRAFPITDPRHGISLCDAEGREILWIDRLEDVPASVRSVLEDELVRRHFLPIIEQVLAIEGASEPTQWTVRTDRGQTTFSLKSEEDVRRVAGHRLLIVDAFGIRFLIPDLRALDGPSRRLLERYV